MINIIIRKTIFTDITFYRKPMTQFTDIRHVRVLAVSVNYFKVILNIVKCNE